MKVSLIYDFDFNYQMQMEVWQQRDYNEYKPKWERTELQRTMNSSQTMQLQEWIQYCYYTIQQISTQVYNNNPITLSPDTIEKIKLMNKRFVKANVMPCLIYQHLTETFYSLLEAYYDADLQLVKAEIQEVKETISSFNPKRQQGFYQSFNHLEIDENFTDCFLKEKFVHRINELVEQCLKSPSNNKKAKKPKIKAKDVEKIVIKKQADLKKRHEERIKPLLGKLISRIKVREENTKLSEQRQFLLLHGISRYKNSN